MSTQIILTKAKMLRHNRQFYIGLWCPVVITSQKKTVLGQFFPKCIISQTTNCSLDGSRKQGKRGAVWALPKQGSKERGGQSGDLVVQLHLQLGIVEGGVRNSE